MPEPYKNICFRCGKERIVSKVYEERVGISTVVTTEMICPDKLCQAANDKDIRKQKNKRIEREERKKESLKARRRHATA